MSFHRDPNAAKYTRLIGRLLDTTNRSPDTLQIPPGSGSAKMLQRTNLQAWHNARPQLFDYESHIQSIECVASSCSREQQETQSTYTSSLCSCQRYPNYQHKHRRGT